jgi:hypothetical protein
MTVDVTTFRDFGCCEAGHLRCYENKAVHTLRTQIKRSALSTSADTIGSRSMIIALRCRRSYGGHPGSPSAILPDLMKDTHAAWIRRAMERSSRSSRIGYR